MALDIAILGSGVAGLSSAWYLGKNHRISLFEKSSSLGLGQKSVSLETAIGKVRVDVPPRVMNPQHYTSLFDLLEEADLDTYSIKQEASFNTLAGDTYLAFSTVNAGRFSLTAPKFSLSSAMWLGKHGLDLVRFYRTLWFSKDFGARSGQSLQSYLGSKGYHAEFVEGFLYPMWSLMCTCPYEDVGRFPARDMLRLLKNFTSASKSRRLKGGTKEFEIRLSSRLHKCHLGTKVLSVSKVGSKMEVVTDGGALLFDHVIIATEPKAARFLVKGFGEDEEALKQVPYYTTKMLLHTDESFMPRNREKWAPVNLFWDKKAAVSTATLWMDKIEASKTYKRPLFQTWDPVTLPDKKLVLGERRFQRTLVTPRSARALSRLRRRMKTDKDRRIWYVGAYMARGVPLLENGVQSAKMVAKWIEKSQAARRR